MSPSGLAFHAMSITGVVTSRPVASMFGGGIGAQRFSDTAIEVGPPLRPPASCTRAPTS